MFSKVFSKPFKSIETDLFSHFYPIFFFLRMFSKAPIKRYNDEVNETPAPGDYDPKEAKSRGSKIAHSTSARFNEVGKSVTPGKFLSFKHSMATANLNKREELVINIYYHSIKVHT